MRALGRPLLNNWLCLLSAATQQHALVMHAGSGRCIPELRDVYELAPLMTYDGWEGDVGYVERRWANDGQVDIQSEVGRMRRKQCLHEGDRSDAALQVLDGVKQGLTYPGWEEDVGYVERRWVNDGQVDIQREVEALHRAQLLHAALS